MRVEFLEPPRSLQPNLASAETSRLIPPLKKLAQLHICFFFSARKGGLVPSTEENALYVEKKFTDGKNRLESANQPASLKSLHVH